MGHRPLFVWIHVLVTMRLNSVRSFQKASRRNKRLHHQTVRPLHATTTTTNLTFSLDDTRHVMAPMVGASDYPFRCLCRQYGNVHLTFTQMLHSRHLIQDPSFSKAHLDLYEYQPLPETFSMAQQYCLGDCERLWELPPTMQPHTTGPLMVQLAGHDPHTVVQAARHVLKQSQRNNNQSITGVDFNCGCPQGIARKGNYGAFLMEHSPETVYEILSQLRATLPSHVLVSAKIRLPRNPSLQTERIQRLVDTGIDFLTIHARTLTENKTKVGPIHMDRLRDAVQVASPRVPVIANGGVQDYSDVQALLQTSGAHACMSSEGLLERPRLFVQAASLCPQRRFAEQLLYARSYLDWCRYAPPLHGVSGPYGGSFSIVRRHLFQFLYRYLQEHTDLRDSLANCKTTQHLHHAYALVDALEARYDASTDWDHLSSSTTTWYRRHRNEINAKQITSSPPPVLTLKERKAGIKARIAQLRTSNKQKKKRRSLSVG